MGIGSVYHRPLPVNFKMVFLQRAILWRCDEIYKVLHSQCIRLSLGMSMGRNTVTTIKITDTPTASRSFILSSVSVKSHYHVILFCRPNK